MGTARTAAEQVAELLKQIQEKVVQSEDSAADTGRDGDPGRSHGADRHDHLDRASAQYNGINLVSAAATDQTVTVAINRDAAGALTTETLTSIAQDLETLGAALTIAQATPDDIDTLIDSANTAAAAFGAAQTRIEAQNEFLASRPTR